MSPVQQKDGATAVAYECSNILVLACRWLDDCIDGSSRLPKVCLAEAVIVCIEPRSCKPKSMSRLQSDDTNETLMTLLYVSLKQTVPRRTQKSVQVGEIRSESNLGGRD